MTTDTKAKPALTLRDYMMTMREQAAARADVYADACGALDEALSRTDVEPNEARTAPPPPADEPEPEQASEPAPSVWHTGEVPEVGDHIEVELNTGEVLRGHVADVCESTVCTDDHWIKLRGRELAHECWTLPAPHGSRVR